METISIGIIISAASDIIRRAVDVEKSTHIRTFKEHFGVSPWVVCCVWNRLALHSCLPPKAAPIHLLWTLLFLKVYSTERVLANTCGCDPETFRDWVKSMLHGLVWLEDFVVRVDVAWSTEWLTKANGCASFFIIANARAISIYMHRSFGIIDFAETEVVSAEFQSIVLTAPLGSHSRLIRATIPTRRMALECAMRLDCVFKLEILCGWMDLTGLESILTTWLLNRWVFGMLWVLLKNSLLIQSTVDGVQTHQMDATTLINTWKNVQCLAMRMSTAGSRGLQPSGLIFGTETGTVQSSTLSQQSVK